MPQKRHSPMVSLRLPPELAAACEKAAAEMDLSVGAWLRHLAEQATGVKADVKQGFAALTETKHRRISRRAAKARWRPEDGK